QAVAEWLIPVGKNDARLRAELAEAKRDRLMETLGDFLATCSKRAGQYKDGVRAPHFGVDGDRLLACSGNVVERAAARNRAGESNGFDRRVLDDRNANFRARVEQQGKNAVGNSFRLYRSNNGLADKFTRAGMSGMSLHDD